jgi:Glycosyl hydrolases family 38 C-terminal domain
MTSGAYLFLPVGPPHVFEPVNEHQVRIIRGPVSSQVVVYLSYVVHQVTIHQSPGIDSFALEIDNQADVTGQWNIEVGMRLKTGIRNGRAVYTDLNAFQLVKLFTMVLFVC